MKPIDTEHKASYETVVFDPNLEKGWFASFLSRFRLLALILIIITVAGWLAMRSLPLESSPEVNIGKAIVSIAYPGASPETLESQVTKEVEKEIERITEVDTYESTIRPGSSTTVVTFKSDADTADALRKVKDGVDLISSQLPEDALDPVVKEVSFSDQPIWTLAISGDMDTLTLTRYAERLADELESVSGVREVQVSGGDTLEYHIEVDPDKLKVFGLTLDQVNSALRGKNINLPLESVIAPDGKHSVAIDTKIYTIQEILSTIIKANQSDSSFGVIRVSDIGDVVARSKDRDTIARFSPRGSGALLPSQSSVQLSVIKRSGGSIIDLVESGNARIKELQSQGILPDTLTITTILDNSEQIRLDLSHLIRDGIITVTIVILVHFVVIGVIEAFVAGLAVPIVFLITFVVMSMFGQTLNFLSMFSLILSLGLLVDDAIVVITAINQYKRNGNLTTKQAILLVIRDFKIVLISTTLTVVWIFSAMLFMTGLIGKFIFSIPFILTVTLLASLVVALTLNPALSLYFASLEGTRYDLKLDAKIAHLKSLYSQGIRSKIFACLLTPYLLSLWGIRRLLGVWLAIYPYLSKGLLSLHPVEERYARLLAWFLEKPFRSRSLVIGVTLAFFLACALPATGLLKTEFFPKTDQGMMAIQIEAPAGTPIEETSEIVRRVESHLESEREIEALSTEIGRLSDLSSGESQIGTQYATITLNLVKTEYGRVESSLSMAERFRQDFASFSGAHVTVSEMSGGPPAGADFSLRIAGDDPVILERVSQDIIKLVRDIPGALNVRSSDVSLPSEFRIVFDEDRLAEHGLSLTQVSSFLRNASVGQEIWKIQQDDREIPVLTKLSGDNKNLNTLLSQRITTPSGQVIPLSSVASVSITRALSNISRYEGKRVITITASADTTTNSQELLKSFNEKTINYKLPSGVEFLFGGANEENAKSVASLGVAMLFGMILIVATLVILFDSFRQSLLVLVTIPLSLIGVFTGLTLTMQPLSFPGMIGLVALFGIVVRNGIILFDKINHNREHGMELVPAILDAGRTRLEPVALTSICTILGMVPLSLSNPTWTPLALSIIFGLAASTILTLIILPILYYRSAIKKLPH